MRNKPVAQTAFPSLSRAANTYTSQEFDNSGGFPGVVALVDTTAGAGSVVVTLEGYDETSGKWYPLLASSSLSGVASTPLLTYPGATVAANSVGQWPVPSKWRVKAVVSAAALTFSVGTTLVN